MALLIDDFKSNEVPIDDATATANYNRLETAKPDELPALISSLKRYSAFKKNQLTEETDTHYENLYTNETYFNRYANEPAILEASKQSLFPKNTGIIAANQAFIAYQAGIEPDKVGASYEALRNSYSKQNFNKPYVNDIELFDLVKEQYKTKKIQREAIDNFQGDAVVNAFQDIANGAVTPTSARVKEFITRNPKAFTGLDEAQLLKQYGTIYDGIRKSLEPNQADAKKVYDLLTSYTGVSNDGKPQINDDQVKEFTSTFVGMPSNEREGIYQAVSLAAKSMGLGDDKKFFQQLGESLGRGITDMTGQTTLALQEIDLRRQRRQIESSPNLYVKNIEGKLVIDVGLSAGTEQGILEEFRARRPSEDEKNKLLLENDIALRKVEIIRELYSIADGSVDPIKPKSGGLLGKIEGGLYGAARSLPYTATAAIPYIGPALTGLAIFGSEYNRMRLEYKTLNPDAVEKMAFMSAALQAPVEWAQSKAFLGKLPGTASVLKRMANVRLSLPVRVGIIATLSTIEENTEEFVQDATAVVVDSVSAAIRDDMPEFNPEKAFGNLANTRLDTFFMTLPMVLIGATGASFREFKRGQQYTSDVKMLERAGVSKQNREDISAETDPDVRDQMLKDAWDSRTPEDIAAGEKLMRADVEDALAKQGSTVLPTIESAIIEGETDSEGNPVREYVLKDEKGVEKYRSRDKDAIDTAYAELRKNQLQNVNNGIGVTVDYITDVNKRISRGEDVQKVLTDVPKTSLLAEYNETPTPQTLNRLFETVRYFGGEGKDISELANYFVAASNRGKLVNGIYQSIIKVHEGSDGGFVIRDYSQDNLKRAIAEKYITIEQVRTELAKIAGTKNFENLKIDTDTDVIESFSDVAMAFMYGKLQIEQLPPGLRTFLLQLAEFVKEILKRSHSLTKLIAKGEVTQDFQQLLASSVGLDTDNIIANESKRAQDRIEREALDAIEQGANYSITKAEDSKFLKLRKRLGAVHKLVGDMFGDEVAFTTNSGTEDAATELVLKENEDNSNAVLLETIYTPENLRGSGSGNRMMKKFLAEVDKLGMDVRLSIDPEATVNGMNRGKNKVPMSISQLRTWYSKFGFQFVDYGDEFSTIGFRPSRETSARQMKESLPPIPIGEVVNETNSFASDQDLRGEFDMGESERNRLKKAGWYYGPDFKEGQIYYVEGGGVYTLKDGKLMKHRGTSVEDGKTISRSSNIVPEDQIPRFAEVEPMTSDSANYSITKAEDSKFLDLAKDPETNRDALQTMVDAAAKAAGGERAFHGSVEPRISVFKGKRGVAVHVSSNRDEARGYAEKYPANGEGQKPTIYDLYYFARNTFDARNKNHTDKVGVKIPSWDYKDLEANLDNIQEAGFDSYLDYEHFLDKEHAGVALFSPNQIKSADPVTRNESGNVIPLSERFNPETPDINYSVVPAGSIRHVYLKEQDKFNKLMRDGRVIIKQPLSMFEGMNILMHQPDTAFAGEVTMDGTTLVTGKGGVYYPALFADEGRFWASTTNAANSMAAALNRISKRNGGKILMGLTSADVDKLFSSTTMSNGALDFFKRLSDSPERYGITKNDFHRMLVEASNAKLIVTKDGITKIKTFPYTLNKADGLDANIVKMRKLLEPDTSVFGVRKEFVISLAKQTASLLKVLTQKEVAAQKRAAKEEEKNPDPVVRKRLKKEKEASDKKRQQSEAIASILAGETNKYASGDILSGKLSTASILQGLGDLLSEPLVKTFQQFNNTAGNLYAVIEIDGEVEAIATPDHESYPYTIVSKDGKMPIVHILDEAHPWHEVVRDIDTKLPIPAEKRTSYFPTSGVSKDILEVVAPTKPGMPLNYSITKAGENRVLDALEANLRRNPDARLEIYNRAKDAFERVLEKRGMTDDPNKKFSGLLQSMGELNAILSVLPAEIRGKVGGMMPLANLGKGTTSGNRQATIDKFLEKRIEMVGKALENTLRKEYDRKLDKLFKRAEPSKNKAGEKPKGKAGASVHTLFDVLRNAKTMSDTEAQAHHDKVMAIVDSGETDDGRGGKRSLTGDEIAHMTHEANLVLQIGDWKNKDASERATAVGNATEVFDKGYADFKEKNLIKKEKQKEISDALKINAGSKFDLSDRQQRQDKDQGIAGSLRKGAWYLRSFADTIEGLFGRKSVEGQRLVDMERTAAFKSEDANQDDWDEINDLFKSLAGGNDFKAWELRAKMVEKTVETVAPISKKPLKFSQFEAVDIILTWRREKGKAHMIGNLDDKGIPVGEWHYDQAFVNDVESQLTDNGRAWMTWLAQKYKDEWEITNPTFVNLQGINLSRDPRYYPISATPLSDKGSDMVDPVTGLAMLPGSGSPGFLKSINPTAIAEPKIQDSLQKFLTHRRQLNHWLAYAPVMAEINPILGKRNLMNHLETIGGKEGADTLRDWLTFFTQGGNRDATARKWYNQAIQTGLNRLSGAILIGRMSVIAVQSVQLGAAQAEMSASEYLPRIAELLFSPSGWKMWKAALDTEYIKRRIKSMPPSLRAHHEQLMKAPPTRIRYWQSRIGETIAGADGLFTAGTFAMIYDQRKAKFAKEFPALTDSEIDTMAQDEAVRLTEKLAQPTRAGTRSQMELQSGVAMKTVWNFSSEPRQKLMLAALRLSSKEYTFAEKARAAFVTWGIGGMVLSIIRASLRDIRDGGDDDDWFDERNWSVKRLALESAMGPFQGLPFVGDAVAASAYAVSGEYHSEGGMLTAIPKGVKSGIDIWSSEDTGEAIRHAENIMTAASFFNDNAAAGASFSHFARDMYGIGKNVIPDGK